MPTQEKSIEETRIIGDFQRMCCECKMLQIQPECYEYLRLAVGIFVKKILDLVSIHAQYEDFMTIKINHLCDSVKNMSSEQYFSLISVSADDSAYEDIASDEESILSDEMSSTSPIINFDEVSDGQTLVNESDFVDLYLDPPEFLQDHQGGMSGLSLFYILRQQVSVDNSNIMSAEAFEGLLSITNNHIVNAIQGLPR
jgi:hypothetical protein